MATLDDVRTYLRVISNRTDSEIDDDISAALTHMRRVGVRESLLREDSLDPQAKYAIQAFCKSSYGFDNSEGPTWWSRYQITVASLLNSSANECAGESSESTGGSLVVGSP